MKKKKTWWGWGKSRGRVSLFVLQNNPLKEASSFRDSDYASHRFLQKFFFFFFGFTKIGT